jgi:hypothetical protein
MKNLLYILCLFPLMLLAQAKDSSYVDSLGKRQGFHIIPMDITQVINGRLLPSIAVNASGLCIDNKSEGLWIARDEKNGAVVSLLFYEKDTLKYEVHYKRGKIKSIVYYSTKPHKAKDEYHANYLLVADKVISFGRNGNIKEFAYLSKMGEMIIVRKKREIDMLLK